MTFVRDVLTFSIVGQAMLASPMAMASTVIAGSFQSSLYAPQQAFYGNICNPISEDLVVGVDGNGVSLVSVDGFARYGRYEVAGSRIEYTPYADWGEEILTYTIQDSSGATATGNLFITLNGGTDC